MDLTPTPSPEWACWKLRKSTLQINCHCERTNEVGGPTKSGLAKQSPPILQEIASAAPANLAPPRNDS